jgi:hypothetical protein
VILFNLNHKAKKKPKTNKKGWLLNQPMGEVKWVTG